MGIAWGSVSGGGGLDELAVDRLELAASRSLEGVCGDAIGVAEATAGCLVEHGERVGGEDTLLAARLLEAVGDVLGGIGWGGLAEVEPGMHPRPKGAVLAQSHAVVHFGQADQDQAEQRPLVPLVVGQDVQVVEHVLVEQVGPRR